MIEYKKLYDEAYSSYIKYKKNIDMCIINRVIDVERDIKIISRRQEDSIPLPLVPILCALKIPTAPFLIIL